MSFKTLFILSLILVLLALGVLLGRDIFLGSRAMRIFQNIEPQAQALELSIQELNIKQAAALAPELIKNLADLEQSLGEMRLISFVPGIQQKLEVIKILASTGCALLQEAEPLITAFNEITTLLQNIQNTPSVNFEDIPVELKQKVLQKFFTTVPLLKTFRVHLAKAQEQLNTLPQLSLTLLNPPKPFLTLLNPSFILSLTPAQFRDKLMAKAQALDQQIAAFLKLAALTPEIAGFPEERAYLLLLLNNFELRPGGGFIGTYGILKIKDGEITEFTTDDIYNLDKPSEKLIAIVPPAPLQKYIPVKKWFMRDSNWSPDFTINAAKALAFYHTEGGAQADEIQGVIGLTPTFIINLLNLTGPLEAGGEKFDAANFTDKLEWRVEKGYAGLKIPETQRKEIIGELGKKLKTALVRLPLTQWPIVRDAALSAIEERHLLLFSTNPAINREIASQGADGVLLPYNHDYLAVVDANLSSLKTDEVMRKSIEYDLKQVGHDLVSTVTLRYHNEGIYSWKWTRYRTYTRIFVPLDSTLIKSTGAMENDKIRDPKGRPGRVDQGNEGGKTFFGAFISIEPGEEKQLTFSYKLPPGLAEKIQTEPYQLLAQKQAGTLVTPLTLRFNFAKMIQHLEPTQIIKNIEPTKVTLETDLRVDREIKVAF